MITSNSICNRHYLRKFSDFALKNYIYSIDYAAFSLLDPKLASFKIKNCTQKAPIIWNSHTFMLNNLQIFL